MVAGQAPALAAVSWTGEALLAPLNERILHSRGAGEDPPALEVTLLTPAGRGPFPLAVVNHGSADAGQKPAGMARSVARLSLMAEREYVDGVFLGVVMVERDIAGIAKRNDQFAPTRRFGKRPADVRRRLQEQQLTLDRLGCAAGRLRTLGEQEAPASIEPRGRAFGDDYSWQSGRRGSLSSPQVRSQARVSSPVRWRPVSA